MSHRELATSDPVQADTIMSVIAEQQGCDEAGRDFELVTNLMIETEVFDRIDDKIKAEILSVIARRPDLFDQFTYRFIKLHAGLVASRTPAWIESERLERAMDAAEENHKFKEVA